jgi:hypothetical protein
MASIYIPASLDYGALMNATSQSYGHLYYEDTMFVEMMIVSMLILAFAF